MPSPVLLGVVFVESSPELVPMHNATLVDGHTAIVTWPVDVWFEGSRPFEAVLELGVARLNASCGSRGEVAGSEGGGAPGSLGSQPQCGGGVGAHCDAATIRRTLSKHMSPPASKTPQVTSRVAHCSADVAPGKC